MNDPVLISPEEVALSLGKSDPEPIRAALRAGTFPIGYAYRNSAVRSKWVYIIPRAPWEYFLRTGRVPDAETVERITSPPTIGDAAVLREAAQIYQRIADSIENKSIVA